MKRIIVVALALLLLLASGCEGRPAIDAEPQDPLAPGTEGEPAESPAEPAETDPAPTLPADAPETAPFRFTRDNFPRLDGSTSMIPLGEAIACVLLGAPREDVGEFADFSKTTQAYVNLARSRGNDNYGNFSDIVIAAEPDWDSVNNLTGNDDAKAMLEIAPIALDALVFMVNEANPVGNLTTEQLQKIYTGDITNWEQVGGHDVEIVAFQRNVQSGSQVLMDKLVMPGLISAPAPSEYMPGEMGDLIVGLRNFDGAASAIGYTVYYYANDMKMAEGLKILSIDGVAPGDRTIASGEYPFVNPYFAAIRKDAPADSPERILYNWLLSDEGRSLITREGYVSAEG